MNTSEWKIETRPISDIEQLLDEGYEIEVDGLDGFVPVSAFVHKGEWQEYQLTTASGTVVRCNKSHLFETPFGWKSAEDLAIMSSCHVYTKNGIEVSSVKKHEQFIPIVDIQVDHPNHRYFTNGVSSHNTGVGKSLFMCHVAASTLLLGKRVLYITLEMAEERIAQRIDANLLDVTMDMLTEMPRQMYESAFKTLTARQQLGKMIIKEYPTSGGHVGHFRTLLDELALKKQFVPDLLIVDYINICSSVRFKQNGQTNSYTYVKSIAEELRGLAVEYNIPCLTATQFNREGFDSSDPSLTNTSESFGLPQTADLQIAVVTSEELEQNGLVMVKQLKNRYADPNKFRRFTLKVDRSRMKLGNAPKQDYLSDPIPTPPSHEVAKPNFGPKRPPASSRMKPGNDSPAGLLPSSASKFLSPVKITF